MAGLAEDVTRRKRLERQLVRTERLAALGRLVAVVGHELRNPLAAIRTSVHLLRRGLGRDDARLAAAAERIDRNVGRCEGIVRELEALARAVTRGEGAEITSAASSVIETTRTAIVRRRGPSALHRRSFDAPRHAELEEAAAEPAALAAAVGTCPLNPGQASAPPPTWVSWSITSETRIAYGSRVRRHGRSRPTEPYHASSACSTRRA